MSHHLQTKKPRPCRAGHTGDLAQYENQDCHPCRFYLRSLQHVKSVELSWQWARRSREIRIVTLISGVQVPAPPLPRGFMKISNDVIVDKGNLNGKGVYANRDFKKGEVVVKYNLKPLTEEELEKLPENEKMFTHTHWGVTYLYSKPERYVNHSENSNTYQDLVNKCDVALRDINKGEMITTDATKDDIS